MKTVNVPIDIEEYICFRLPIGYAGSMYSSETDESTDIYKPWYAVPRFSKSKLVVSVTPHKPNVHELLFRHTHFVPANDTDKINMVIKYLNRRGYKDDDIVLEKHQTWKHETWM